jgi:hypothetical protein
VSQLNGLTKLSELSVRRMTLLIAMVALGCAGLGVWLGTTVADDVGSIVLITLGCGVLGSFAPGAVRWALGDGRRHGPPAR